MEPPAPSRTKKGPAAADHVAAHLSDRVRKLRDHRRWSLDTLAKVCGVSRSMLSEIERKRVNPTLGVVYNIARAFGMSVSELVEIPGASSALHVIRAEDRTYHYRSDADCRIRTLSPLDLQNQLEFYEVSLRPGGALRSSAHFARTREFLTVARGRVDVLSAGESERLTKGDSISYPADVPHAIVNAARTEAVVFLVVVFR